MKAGIRLAATATALVLTAVPLHLLGVAGWRLGFALCAVVLALVAATVAWLLFRGAAARNAWVATAVITAAVVAGVLYDKAPPSTSRLSAELERLKLPAFTLERERTAGHGWCRPRCPIVIRTYRGPLISEQAAMGHFRMAVRSIPADPRIEISAEADLDTGSDPGLGDDRLTLTVRAEATR